MKQERAMHMLEEISSLEDEGDTDGTLQSCRNDSGSADKRIYKLGHHAGPHLHDIYGVSDGSRLNELEHCDKKD